MSKKKWEQDAERLHRSILDLLKVHEGRGFSQSDVKGDFFRVFREAYEGGYCHPLRFRSYADTGRHEWIWRKGKPIISGDSIWAFAREQGWVHPEIPPEDERYIGIERVMSWWDAWTFAWLRLGHLVRCHRIIEDQKDPIARSVRLGMSRAAKPAPPRK